MSAAVAEPTAAAPAIPRVAVPPTVDEPIADAPIADHAVDRAASDEEEFAGFARAIAIGTAIGLPAIMALLTVALKLATPDISTWGLVAIVVWTGIWTGVFLGGTVTVGLWAARQH